MKKLFALVLSAVMLLSCFISCAGSKEESGEHVHDYSKTPCTEIQKCKCGKTNGEKMGYVHDFKDNKCIDCDETLRGELTRMAESTFDISIFGSGNPQKNGICIRMEFEDPNPSVTIKYVARLYVSEAALNPDDEYFKKFYWTFTKFENGNSSSSTYINGNLDATTFTCDSTISDYEIHGITEEEGENYAELASVYMHRILKEKLISLLERKDNVNKISLADLGFVNYK